MEKSMRGRLGLVFGLLSLTSLSVNAALVEYRGSTSAVVNGVERNLTLSLTIDNEFTPFGQTLQYMRDHYPSTAGIDQYYGYFVINNSSLSLEGAAPVTGTSGQFHIWVTDIVDGGGYDTSTLRLETEDVVTDWSQHTRFQFLEDSGEPFVWDSWWGDSPTNDLPPLMELTRLDVLGVGADSEYHSMDFQQLQLRPVPLPAAAWLFGCGLVGLLGVMRRSTNPATK
jgi:hypothetical protein